MKRSPLRALLLTAGLVALASAAVAQPDVEIAFDPAEVCPGETVTLISSIENTGTEPSTIDLEVAVSINGMPLFSFPASLFLAAGELRTSEVSFFLPPPTPPLELTIDVSASDGNGSDSASATLTVNDCGVTGDSHAELGEAVERALKDSSVLAPTDPESVTWGAIKSTFAN